MASKSVTAEMILKARDEFSATYKQFEEVLKKSARANTDLNKTFGATAEGAERARDALNDIGKADKGIDKIAQTLESLITKTTGLKALETTAVTLAQKIKDVSQSIADARSQQGDPAIARDFDALTAAAIKTRQAIKATSDQLEQMQAAARDKALAGNRADLEQAVADHSKLTAAYEKQRATLQTLIASERERINSAVAKADTGVEAATQKYAEQAARIEQLAAAKGKDGQQTATQAKQLATAQARLLTYGEAVDKAKAALAGAQREQQAFSNSVVASDKVRKAAENLRAMAQQARVAGDNIKVAAAGLNAVAIPPATQARLDKLAITIKALEQDYNILTAQADKAGAALRNSLGPPPKGLQQELTKLNGQMAATQARIKEATGSINQMQTELNEAGVDTADLAVAQQRLAGTAGQLATRKKELAAAIEKANAAQRSGNNEARTALNVTQRLRGQVLSLISAYVGLYGAAQQVAEVFNSASRVEGIESRFKVAFGGDLAKTVDEMRFIREEGERLKVNWLSLGESYSRFLTALPPGAMALEDTRKIFTGFATAARVARLSTDDVNGIFVALTQMASKGTISMEELRQQLGDRLPGAVNIFAEAAGFGQDEIGKFFKAVEQGQVSSAVMVKAAELIQQKYGAELPGALDSASAAIGEFENEVINLRLAVAESGFLETLSQALRNLSETLRDPSTQENMKLFAAGIGELISGAVALAPHLSKIIGFFIAWQGYKVGAFLVQIATGMKAMNVEGSLLKGGLPGLAKNMIGFAGSLHPVVKAILLLAAGWALINGMTPELDNSFDKIEQSLAGLKEGFEGVGDLPTDLGALSNGQLKKSLEERETLLAEAVQKAKDIQAQLAPEGGPPLILRRDDIDAAKAGLEEARVKVAELEANIKSLNAELSTRGSEAIPVFAGNLKNTEDNIKSVSDALLALENVSADSAIQQLNAAFDATKRAYEDAGKSGAALAQLERERAEAMVTVEQYRSARTIQILAGEAAQKLQLLDQEGLKGEELALAQREIITDMADFRITETERAITAVGNELERAKGLERQYADEVKRLQQSIADEIDRQADVRQNIGGTESSLAAYQRYQEQRQRMAQLTADTERALEEGNYKLAEELARKREALAMKMAETEIIGETTGKKIVANEDARAESAKNILSAHQQINEAMASQEGEAQAAADAQAALVNNLTAGLDNLNTTLVELQSEKIELNAVMDTDELNEQIARVRTEAYATPLTTRLELDDKSALVKLANLQKPTQSVHTVKLVVDASGIPRGVVPGLAAGGPIPGFAGGGRIRGPGTGTSDSILMRGANGEWVINAAAVRYWGDDFMRSINSRQLPPMPAFSAGGPVGRLSDFTSAANDEPRGDVVTLSLTINNTAVGDVRGERSVIDTLVNELRGLK